MRMTIDAAGGISRTSNPSTLLQPSGAQAPTMSTHARGTITLFSLWKKILSILLWLTLITPLVAFFHVKVAGSPSHIWLFLTWRKESPLGVSAPHSFQQPPPQISPDATDLISPQAITGDGKATAVHEDIPTAEDTPAGEKPADDVVPDAPPPPVVDVVIPPFDWDGFRDKMVSAIRSTPLSDEIKAALVEHLEWMIAQRWRPKFIERTIIYSLQMEAAGVFSALPERLIPNEWFLVSKANKRMLLNFQRSAKNPGAPADTDDLWKSNHLQLLRRCDDAYAKFLEDNGLDKVAGPLMSMYADAGYAGKADGDVFNWAIADIIYPPGTEFHFKKPHIQEDITTALDKKGLTQEQVRNFLAAKYAFAQGMMRKVKEFPARSGDEVTVFRRLWPNGERPSFIVEHYWELFNDDMRESECPLDTWDTRLEALHRQFPALIAEDGTLLDESGVPAKFEISTSDSYPVQSFSLAAPGQKEVGFLPGDCKRRETKSFGCMAIKTKASIHSVFEPSCFMRKGVPIERELILLAMKCEAQVSLFKSNQAYNEEVVAELSTQYSDKTFQKTQ
jgi:hypothetical protein